MLYQKPRLPLLFLYLTLIGCSLAEIILLEIKYQFFSGGFLQSNQLVSLSQRITFLLSFFAFNFILYGGLYWIWQKTFNSIAKCKTIVSFHFMMTTGIATAVVLAFQFQLHKYFADAMDATLIKHIAGGSLQTAILYAADEALLLALGFSVLVGVYYLIYRFAKNRLLTHEYNIEATPKKIPLLALCKYFSLTITFSVTAVLAVNSDDALRYNLARSNSFSLISSTLDYLSDVDQDGYGSFQFPQDSSAFDSSIYPGALDIPNNGIDEDGLFGDFIEPESTTYTEPVSSPLKKPINIIIIMMESARADIVGKRIDAKLVAPHINTLAQEGQSIEEAYSHTGYTASSLATFFSGNLGDHFDPNQSLFPILKSLGYQTAIFSGQDESWGNIDQLLGSRIYSDHFYDAQVGVEERVFSSKLPSSIKLSEETLWNKFKRYSDTLNWERPQFIYFNMQAGHFPYFHENMVKRFIDVGIPRSEISKDNEEWLQNTYWNAMHYADIYIGQIIQEIKSKGAWEDTLLIISGDHGEELFDNNHLGHGFFLSDVQTRIPLIISKKDFKVDQPVGHADMKHLILSYVLGSAPQIKNRTQPHPKSVFQMIGGLNRPNKIALRYADKKRITLDLKNMLVQPLGETNWLDYDSLKDEKVMSDLKKLVLYWENLRWQNHLNSEKNSS